MQFKDMKDLLLCVTGTVYKPWMDNISKEVEKVLQSIRTALQPGAESLNLACSNGIH